jgi:TonB family protein
MATPPPEEPPPAPSKKADEAGPKKKDDGGGKRSQKEEGKFGRKDTQKKEHEIEGPQREAIVTKVRGMGLLGALAGGDSLKGALDSDNVGALLSGLGSARTDLGAGAGGKGLRGVGSGGGGDGPGSLMGGGSLGTGMGSGRGGAGGAGGKGLGSGGGGRGEAKVAVTPGTPTVSGYLSAEQINRVVRANQAALRYCYEAEVQRQRGLRGKVVVQWRVDRAGGVPMARVASSTLSNAAVEGCLVRQVRKWRFPKPDGGEVSVMYPFIFGVGG